MIYNKTHPITRPEADQIDDGLLYIQSSWYVIFEILKVCIKDSSQCSFHWIHLFYASLVVHTILDHDYITSNARMEIWYWILIVVIFLWCIEPLLSISTLPFGHATATANKYAWQRLKIDQNVIGDAKRMGTEVAYGRQRTILSKPLYNDDIIKWKHFPRYWPFVQGIYRSPVNSPHKGQWRGALIFALICVWINGWVNTREAGDLRRYRAHYDVNVM